MKRKLISWGLAFSMLLTMMPIPAMAAVELPKAGSETVAANSPEYTIAADTDLLAPLRTTGSDHADHNDEWTALPTTINLQNNKLDGGNYYLTDNVTANAAIDISGDVTLCLNGKVLDLNGNTIEVGNFNKKDSLTICDCQTTPTYGNINADGLWEKSDTSGDCDLVGGVITGGQGKNGVIHVAATGSSGSATLTLNSGNIAGNNASSSSEACYGGGVYVDGYQQQT